MKNIKTFLTPGLFSLAIAIAGLAVQPSAAWAQAAQKYNDEGKKIVPYVPTPQEVVERMLELAQVKKGDVVYDLGSGDGRIVVTAAKKYGVKAVVIRRGEHYSKPAPESIPIQV